MLAFAAALSAACTSTEERGRQLYAQHGCVACHGPTGHGDGPTSKRLDVPPRDFADPRAYSQGSSPREIATSIRRGGGSMPAFRDLTDEEAMAIATWIVSLQRPGGQGVPR